MSEKLKPCPFCGGEARMHVAFASGGDHSVGVYVECLECRSWSGTKWGDGALTHEQPDTWERIEADCSKFCIEYCDEHGLLDSVCNAAEGDASTRHCTDCGNSCEERMARDLVRRCRALAERGER